jgi:hypothetical protein
MSNSLDLDAAEVLSSACEQGYQRLHLEIFSLLMQCGNWTPSFSSHKGSDCILKRKYKNKIMVVMKKT